MAAFITPGKLDRRVSIQQAVRTHDTSGALVETWAEVVKVWAARWYQRGAEISVASDASQQVVTGVKFIIRYRPNILTNMQLVCEGQSFSISGVEEVGRRQWLVLLADAKAA